MDNQYLQDLINQTRQHGGGMILNLAGKPEVVVLTIEKYNQLLSGQQTQQQNLEDKSQKKDKKILVTGGAGYIGSHAVGELVKNGYEVVIIDNLSCGKIENINPQAKFYQGDLADKEFLGNVFATEDIDAVMHFAASIEVEESVKEPAKYFNNNVINTVNLLESMREAGVDSIIFSSTAAVYGQSEKTPIAESFPLKPNNPYGYSKLLGEKTIKYYCQYAGLRAIVFRYFNACGCRASGDIKPTHHSHLIDNVMEVAAGKKPAVEVFGNDYPTFDGTGVRDYVHVLDIARAHVLALENFNENSFEVYNIGTGKGRSVSEIVNTTAEILNKIIPMDIAQRRPGDAAETIADSTKIFRAWGFKPLHSDLASIIQTAWKQKQLVNVDNP